MLLKFWMCWSLCLECLYLLACQWARLPFSHQKGEALSQSLKFPQCSPCAPEHLTPASVKGAPTLPAKYLLIRKYEHFEGQDLLIHFSISSDLLCPSLSHLPQPLTGSGWWGSLIHLLWRQPNSGRHFVLLVLFQWCLTIILVSNTSVKYCLLH